MNRRRFTAAALSAGVLATASRARAEEGAASPAKFKLKYAPHPGMFQAHAGNDYIDQLKFVADQGFSAWEDNGMMGRPVELQEKAARAMADLGLTMGVFVAHPIVDTANFAAPKAGETDALLKKMREALECAKRVNATWMTVVPGNFTTNLEWDYQTANVIDSLKRCAEIFEALRRQRMTE